MSHCYGAFGAEARVDLQTLAPSINEAPDLELQLRVCGGGGGALSAPLACITTASRSLQRSTGALAGEGTQRRHVLLLAERAQVIGVRCRHATDTFGSLAVRKACVRNSATENKYVVCNYH